MPQFKPDENAKIIAACLETHQGKAMLKVLEDLFYHNDAFEEEKTHLTAFRLGQRDVVSYLLDCIPNMEWKGEN